MTEDICEFHISSKCRQSSLRTTEESEKDEKENAATFHNLTTSIETMVQNLFASVGDYVTTTTHIICLAYLANFYYIAMRDYNKAVTYPGNFDRG